MSRGPGTAIAGSNVVVTGGASGIGRGLCERFAALGAANVVVADLDEDGAQSVAASIGGRAQRCDVADQESVSRLVAETIEAIGHIDIFCANAGVGAGGGLAASDELWDLSWRVNVLGPVFAARQVIPHMTERGGGAFVITASSAALITGPTSFNYATSKHAVLGVAEWLAVNHGPTVAVSAICPTLVDTPMAVEFGAAMIEPMSVEKVVDAAVSGISEGRFLITPAPQSLEMFRAKAHNYDAFLAGMQQRIAALADD